MMRYIPHVFCTKLYKNIYVMLYQSSSSEMKKSAFSEVGVSSGVDSSSSFFFSSENGTVTGLEFFMIVIIIPKQKKPYVD